MNDTLFIENTNVEKKILNAVETDLIHIILPAL